MNTIILAAALISATTSEPGGALDLWSQSSSSPQEPAYEYVKPRPVSLVTTKPVPPAATSRPAEPRKSSTGYPIRGGWWSGCPNWQHLTTGEHAGMFDVEWLKSLSHAEVQSLHSDHHERRVNWSYARRPGQYSRTSSADSSYVEPKPLTKAEKKAEKEIGRQVFGTRDGKHPGPVGGAIRGFFGDWRYRTRCPAGQPCPYN